MTSPMTLIVGTTGPGKSTLLDAIDRPSRPALVYEAPIEYVYDDAAAVKVQR